MPPEAWTAVAAAIVTTGAALVTAMWQYGPARWRQAHRKHTDESGVWSPESGGRRADCGHSAELYDVFASKSALEKVESRLTSSVQALETRMKDALKELKSDLAGDVRGLHDRLGSQDEQLDTLLRLMIEKK